VTPLSHATCCCAFCLFCQGLLPDLPAILLVGGGEGMGKLKATVEELDARLQGEAQVRHAGWASSACL
jgi:UDP-N-acetylglucosamine:LPS N-acetylglucosamine transferase